MRRLLSGIAVLVAATAAGGGAAGPGGITLPTQVEWSPDGSRLAIALPYSGKLFLAKAAERSVRALPLPEAGFVYRDPTWSPDGVWIAFTRNTLATGLQEVGLISAAGNAPARFVVAGTEPAWSPAGDELAYTAQRRNGTAVETIGLDGSGHRVVAAEGRSPVWHPGGRTVAFDSPNGLSTARADGTGEPRVVDPAGSSPLWAPDGSRLAYVADEAVLVRTEGGGTRRLTRPGAPIRWSEDGRVLAVRVEAGTTIVDVETGRNTRLSQEPLAVPSPDWRQLATVVGVGRNDAVYLTGPGDRAPRLLFANPCDGYTSPCRIGGDGPNRLTGSAQRDVLFPGAGDDRVSAGAGHDRVDAGFGDDLVDGGAGNDVLLGQAGNDRLLGGPDRDILVGAGGVDVLDAGPGDDFVAAERDGFRDTIRCGAGRDIVQADRSDRVARDCESVVRV